MMRHAMRLFLIGCVLIACSEVLQAGEPMTVRIMTFNIRLNTPQDGKNRWSERRDLALEVVRRFDGDFIGLQEALPDQLGDLRKALPEFRAIGRSREADANRGEACPILYRRERWRLDPEQHGTFWLSDTPEKPGSITWGNACTRIVTWGRFVNVRSGHGLYVYNTHFDHVSDPSRLKSAALVSQRVADRKNPDPVVLTGDFNCGPASPAIRYLVDPTSDSPVHWVDTFRELHPNAANSGTFHAFRGGTQDEKIDYILIFPSAEVRSSEIVRDHRGDRYPSDHFPVTAEVVFGPKEAIGKQTASENTHRDPK